MPWRRKKWGPEQNLPCQYSQLIQCHKSSFLYTDFRGCLAQILAPTAEMLHQIHPLHSLLGHTGPGRASTAVWCELCCTRTRASHSLSVSVARRGAVAAFECSHKTDRKAVVLLIFCDSEPDTADGKVEYCSSGLAVVGYLHQTHLLPLEWKFHGCLRKQRALRFHCCPLSSWALSGCILNGKKKTVTPRCGRKLLYKGKCSFV